MCISPAAIISSFMCLAGRFFFIKLAYNFLLSPFSEACGVVFQTTV